MGALLDAKAFHPGRTARNHLRCLASTNDISEARIDEVLDIVGLTSVADKRAGKFSLGMGQRLGIAGALLGDPGALLFDEPVNGLDPEGIRWVRHLLRGLAAEGRTVFVSSHLISEMALTAEHLVVIGRGNLIAETSVAEFAAQYQSEAVRGPHADAQLLVTALTKAGVRPSVEDDGAIVVTGLPAAAGRGDRRRRLADPARAHPRPGLARGRLHGADGGLGRIPRPRRPHARRRRHPLTHPTPTQGKDSP